MKTDKRAKWWLVDRLREKGYPALVETPQLSGAEIRAFREEVGLSQAGLARILNASDIAVYRWESGRTQCSKIYCSVLRFAIETYRGGLVGPGDFMEVMSADLRPQAKE